MKDSVNTARRVVTLIVVAALLACSVQPAAAISPVKLNHWSGTVNLSNAGITPFELAGTASHLGQFVANGEVEFLLSDTGPPAGSAPASHSLATG